MTRTSRYAPARRASETAVLDSHAMLARLKLAAGLLWMNGCTDKVSEDHCDLAL
jgi:hypothetical protein